MKQVQARSIDIETDPRRLQRMFESSLLFEEQVATFKHMGQIYRQLQNRKRDQGVCILGMSCLRPVMKGSRGCAYHVAMRQSGKRVRPQYTSEYAIFVKFQREMEKEKLEREAAQAAARRGSPRTLPLRRAARRAA